jgi:hypothetical protein
LRQRGFLFGPAYVPLLNDAPGLELKYGSMSVILRQSECNLAAGCEVNVPRLSDAKATTRRRTRFALKTPHLRNTR